MYLRLVTADIAAYNAWTAIIAAWSFMTREREKEIKHGSCCGLPCVAAAVTAVAVVVTVVAALTRLRGVLMSVFRRLLLVRAS